MQQFKVRASASGKIMGVKGLGKTGQTFVQEWMKEQLYGRRKEFSNKYTEKGNAMEDTSIEMVADFLDLGMLMKNEEFFEGEWCKGTPDVILADTVIDVKNSWDCFTFPLFEKDVPNKDYYYQGQCYMHLTGRKHYKLIYTLTDTPDNLVEKEAKRWAWDNNNGEVTAEAYDRIKANMTYSHLPIEQRIKIFEFDYDEAVIEKMAERVEECRAYLKSITI